MLCYPKFSTFSVTLPDELKINLMLQIWRRSLDTLISLLIPPLSDKEATGEALGAQEIHVVFQWLKVSCGPWKLTSAVIA
jgi:hypothetical protein